MEQNRRLMGSFTAAAVGHATKSGVHRSDWSRKSVCPFRCSTEPGESTIGGFGSTIGPVTGWRCLIGSGDLPVRHSPLPPPPVSPFVSLCQKISREKAKDQRLAAVNACTTNLESMFLKKCIPVRLLLPIILVLVWVRPGVCADDSQTILLQTTGALCAQGLYLTYTSVGTLADAYGKKVYDKKTTGQYLNAYIEIIKRMKERLNKLQDSEAVQVEGSGFWAKGRSAQDSLGAEADAFQTFLTSDGRWEVRAGGRA